MPSRKRIARDRFRSDPSLITLVHLVDERNLTWVDVSPLSVKRFAELAQRLGHLPDRRERLAEYRRLRRAST